MDSPETMKVTMPELAPKPVGDRFIAKQMDLVRGVRLRVAVMLGEAEITVGKLFDLRTDEVVVLDRKLDEPLDLCLDGKVVARGELVVVGDSLGMRIVEILER